eukprot:13268517-Alexandrium_andersonii.AAC.1
MGCRMDVAHTCAAWSSRCTRLLARKWPNLLCERRFDGSFARAQVCYACYEHLVYLAAIARRALCA